MCGSEEIEFVPAKEMQTEVNNLPGLLYLHWKRRAKLRRALQFLNVTFTDARLLALGIGFHMSLLALIVTKKNIDVFVLNYLIQQLVMINADCWLVF